MLNTTYLRRLRMMSLIEGVSTLVLFGVAMPLKYLAGLPMAVTLLGSLHGGLFVLLSLMFLWAIKAVPLPAPLAMGGIVAAVFPFGPFLFDRRLRKISGSDHREVSRGFRNPAEDQTT